ncbi:MAG: hypothetical protein ACPLYD_08040 [Anaerolineae bacterium]
MSTIKTSWMRDRIFQRLSSAFTEPQAEVLTDILIMILEKRERSADQEEERKPEPTGAQRP